jgi:hypothetical protein
VVLADDLAPIPALITLARRARRVVIGNLVLAATVITILSAWNFTIGLPLRLAVAGHEGSTVLVGLNGLRLLRHAARPTAAHGRHRPPPPVAQPATPDVLTCRTANRRDIGRRRTLASAKISHHLKFFVKSC